MAVRGRRGQPGEPGPALREGLPPARPCSTARIASPTPCSGTRTATASPSISWDEALDLIAQKYQEALDEAGPESVAFYGSGPVGDPRRLRRHQVVPGRPPEQQRRAQRPPLHGLGGHGLHDPVPERRAHGVLRGFRSRRRLHPLGQQHGRDAPRPVLPHPGEQEGEPRRPDRGHRHPPHPDHATTPTCTWSSSPNTDLALANGILHLLVANGQVDQAFIQENVVFRRGIEDLDQIGYGSWGPDGLGLSPDDGPAEHYRFTDQARPSSLAELEEFLADYTPERVSEISGVPVGQIHALAEMYGDQGRGTVSLWCMGVNQHIRGTWMNNLITDLHLITGKISRPGSEPLQPHGPALGLRHRARGGDAGQPAPGRHGGEEPGAPGQGRGDLGHRTRHHPRTPGYHTMDMFRAFMRGDVKVMWVQTTNPWVSIPNVNRIKREPNDGRFLIVSDIYPTPTTEAADLMLPSAGWVEREGMFGNSERRTQQWEKAVDPPGEATEDAWQVMEVAKRMGMEHLFPWPDDDWHEPMFEEYRQFGLGIGKDLASYQQLRETRGMLWPVVDGKETRYRYAAGYDPYVKKDEGVHFYKAKGFGEKAAFWLRPYHPPAESPGRRVSVLALHRPHSGALAHRLHDPPGEAAPPGGAGGLRGDEPGRCPRVERQVRGHGAGGEPAGELELTAKVDGRGQPPRGSVFIPFFDEARLANLLTVDAMCNISKEPDYKKCAVRVEKV